MTRIHGEAWPPTPRYRSWAKMMERCYTPRHKHYKNYGGRGIKVSKHWSVCGNFYADTADLLMPLFKNKIAG